MVAARKGHTEVVKALLAVPGVDVNKAEEDGWTAIMGPAWNGHTEVVRALLAMPGIDVNKRATDGWAKGKTALGLALHHGHFDAMIFLLLTALLTALGAQSNKEARVASDAVLGATVRLAARIADAFCGGGGRGTTTTTYPRWTVLAALAVVAAVAVRWPWWAAAFALGVLWSRG